MTPEIVGVLFAVGTSVAFGIGSPIARLGLVGTPVVTGTVISMVAGAALLLAVAAPRYPSELGAIAPSGWGLIAFTAALNYPVGRLLLFNAMRCIGVARGMRRGADHDRLVNVIKGAARVSRPRRQPTPAALRARRRLPRRPLVPLDLPEGALRRR